MRHLKAGNRLGVTTAHRRAMMRNLVTSILENGQITCTLARAKEVRKPLEKMIGWEAGQSACSPSSIEFCEKQRSNDTTI